MNPLGFDEPISMTALIEPRLSPFFAKGIGLYAKVPIPRGTLVSRMRMHGRMRRSAMAAHFAARPFLPHDSIVHNPRSPYVLYDQSWQGLVNNEDIPWWYRMNHSNTPNCVPRLQNPSETILGMGWYTKRDVAINEELTFLYEDAPADWV
jgi:hypothetical protein